MEADLWGNAWTRAPVAMGFYEVMLLQGRDPGEGNGSCASVPVRLSLWHRVTGTQPPVPPAGAAPS